MSLAFGAAPLVPCMHGRWHASSQGPRGLAAAASLGVGPIALQQLSKRSPQFLHSVAARTACGPTARWPGPLASLGGFQAASSFSEHLFKRIDGVWRRQRTRSSANGEDVSTAAQLAADATTEQGVEMQSAAGPAATSSGIVARGSNLTISTGAAMLPHKEKANKAGEDAFFVSDCGRYFGVADGVGGWALSGVDAGEYSRLLMIMAKLFSEASRSMPTPLQILHSAYDQTQVRGSSTACILKFVPDADELHCANLGDSGFLLVRGGAPVFQTPQQQHDFNFPYQLGSKEMGAVSDGPEAAQLMELRLLSGDILVTGTDGLFDNVFAEEVASLVTFARNRGKTPASAAHLLADYTQNKSIDTTHMSPFAYGAQAYGIPYRGGKPDDITVLVSFVQQTEPETGSDQASNASHSKL